MSQPHAQGCRGHNGRLKLTFRSRAEASKWIRNHATPGWTKPFVYECPRCGSFHLTTRAQ